MFLPSCDVLFDSRRLRALCLLWLLFSAKEKEIKFLYLKFVNKRTVFTQRNWRTYKLERLFFPLCTQTNSEFALAAIASTTAIEQKTDFAFRLPGYNAGIRDLDVSSVYNVYDYTCWYCK